MLPWQSAHPAFRAIGAGFLIFDMILFAAFTGLTVARYVLYPRIFLAMIRHETHSLFLGTIRASAVAESSARMRTDQMFLPSY